MAQTISDGRPQVLTAAGPSLPVIITLDSQQAALPPTIAVLSSVDGNYLAQVEITLDRPDQSGNLPSPGNWMPYQEIMYGGSIPGGYNAVPSGAKTLGVYCSLKTIISAVRVNMLSYTAGSCTFSVAQAVIPKLHGL